MKFEKQPLILITVLIFIFALFNLFYGYSLVGKTFQGFGLDYTLLVSPTTQKDWTGYSSFETYDRIITVNGIKIKNVDQFDEIIQQKNPGTTINYTLLRDSKLMTETVETMEFSFEDFLTTYFLTFMVSLAYMFLSIFIFLKGNNDDSIKTLLLFTFLFSISSYNLYDQDFNHKFVALGLFVQIFTLASLIQLGIILNKYNFKEKIYNTLLRINLFSACFIAFGLAITASLIRNNLYYYPAIHDVYLNLFNLFVNYSGISIVVFTALIAYSYFKSPEYSLQKIQGRIILTGSILAFMPLFVFWSIPLLFGYKSSLEYILLPFLAFPFFITYAIIRYKAFDVEVFIRKGLVYSTLSGVLMVSYFTFSTLLILVWHKFFNLSDQTPIAFSAILATMITGKINKKIQTIIDKAFYRQKFDLTNLLEKFINEIPRIFERKELVNTCFSYLENTVNPVFSAFYLFDRQEHNFKLIGTNNKDFQKDKNTKSLSSIQEISSVFNNYDLTDSMVLPLQKDQEMIGILLLGKKKSDIEYLFEEKNFLKNFAVGTSMALDNLMLKEESIELSVKNVELEKMAQFLNNITANLSHDLKHPLNSSAMILNKLSYLIDKRTSVSKELIQNDIEKLHKAFGKINECISISLDREMISLGKLVLAKESVNIKQTCKDSVFLHSDYLKRKGVNIEFDLPEEELFITGDRVRFEHVISNLISNAAKYGGQMIKVKTKRNNSDILIIVEDNGPGIKEDIKDRIFERYVQSGTITNSGTDRSSGLGLFICKTYIEMMNGSIWFESGKGTKFFIRIPLRENSSNRNPLPLNRMLPVAETFHKTSLQITNNDAIPGKTNKSTDRKTTSRISVTGDLPPEPVGSLFTD